MRSDQFYILMAALALIQIEVSDFPGYLLLAGVWVVLAVLATWKKWP